jgi:hypothetical protein
MADLRDATMRVCTDAVRRDTTETHPAGGAVSPS